MKKAFRRSLTLMAVIATVVLLMSFAVSAVNDCGDGNHVSKTRVVEATCESAGYEEIYCSVCGKIFGTTVTSPALGHDFEGVAYQYDAYEDGYKKGRLCNRCDKVQYEVDADNDYVKYYRVELLNPWTADTYWEDVTYTQLVKTFKTTVLSTKKDASYGIWYIAQGDTLESHLIAQGWTDYAHWEADKLDFENLVRRSKDKDYGRYIFEGWTESVKDAGEFTDADLVDFSSKTITDNTKLYAAFSGNAEVVYTVEFINYDGTPLTTKFGVRHGIKADDSIFRPTTDADGNVTYNSDKLVREEDNRSHYEFNGWSVDINHIYGNISIYATYDVILKVYEFEIYTWDPDIDQYVPAVDENGNPITASGNYGGKIEYSADEALIKKLAEKEMDRTYLYSWTGNWSVLNGDYVVNSTNIGVPYGTKDARYQGDEDYAPLKLIPTYNRRLISYKAIVTVKFANTVSASDYEIESYLDNVNIQIMDGNGQYMASGEAKLIPGTNTAQFVCTLYDSKSYTVTAVSNRNKYSGTTTINRTFVLNPGADILIPVTLDFDEEYLEGHNCGCIHHSPIFQGLWVRILNLLYRIFNVKYVCCDDMYATIGDLLVYTP